MEPAALLTFATALGAVLLVPGPVHAVVGAGAVRFGFVGGMMVVTGAVVGGVIWLAVAATGLAAILTTSEHALFVCQAVGAGYLLYLAVKVWRSSQPSACRSLRIDRVGPRLAGAGLAVSLANPHALMFHVALLPSIIGTSAVSHAEFIKLALVGGLVRITILSLLITAVTRARVFALPGTNRFMSVAIAFSAASPLLL